MKTAAAYVRVSTEKQDEYSLDSQLKLIREYAASHDMDVPQEFVFVEDGVSGRSAKKRPAFQHMIGMAKDKARPFDLILVWKYSRFARNQEESIVYKSMLKKLGVDVISISEPLDDSPFGSLIERIIEWMDEFYSIRLSGEVKRGMAEKIARREIVTIPAFGYDVRGKTYVPNAQADTVRRIFSDFLAGKGLTEIARELNAEGVRTRRGSAPNNRWLRYLLLNPVYIGKIRWSRDGKIDYTRGAEKGNDNAVLIDGGFEPIIDADTFAAVREKLERRAAALPYTRHDQPVEWMLKGLVRCSSCGSTLVYTSTACPSMQCYKYAHGSCAVSHSLSVAKASRAVIAELERCASSNVFPLAPQTVKKSDGPDYDRLIAVEELKLRRVAQSYEAGIDTLEEYARKKKRLNDGIEELRRQQADSRSEPAPSSADLRRRVLDVLDIINSPASTEQAKNAALRTILSHIVYDKPAQKLQLFFIP